MEAFQPVLKPKCLKFGYNAYVMLAGGDWEYILGFQSTVSPGKLSRRGCCQQICWIGYEI